MKVALGKRSGNTHAMEYYTAVRMNDLELIGTWGPRKSNGEQ